MYIELWNFSAFSSLSLQKSLFSDFRSNWDDAWLFSSWTRSKNSWLVVRHPGNSFCSLSKSFWWRHSSWYLATSGTLTPTSTKTATSHSSIFSSETGTLSERSLLTRQPRGLTPSIKKTRFTRYNGFFCKFTRPKLSIHFKLQFCSKIVNWTSLKVSKTRLQIFENLSSKW